MAERLTGTARAQHSLGDGKERVPGGVAGGPVHHANFVAVLQETGLLRAGDVSLSDKKRLVRERGDYSLEPEHTELTIPQPEMER